MIKHRLLFQFAGLFLLLTHLVLESTEFVPCSLHLSYVDWVGGVLNEVHALLEFLFLSALLICWQVKASLSS